MIQNNKKNYTDYRLTMSREPIVNTPENAFNCFMRTEIDALVIGNWILYKANPDKSLKQDYKIKYELD